jgi:hypothetical protein
MTLWNTKGSPKNGHPQPPKKPPPQPSPKPQPKNGPPQPKPKPPTSFHCRMFTDYLLGICFRQQVVSTLIGFTISLQDIKKDG